MPPGRIVRLPVESKCLRGNPLGDPDDRQLPVYLPPGYDEDSKRSYPVAFYLAGYMGIGASKLGWKPWQQDFVARLDGLIHRGEIGPLIVAFPDCFTLLGGSQYINSSSVGAYDDHLNLELVPLVDRSFRTLRSRESRAVLGKSSGGFGALVQGMLHPETWGAVACHSGDAGFDLCFLTDMPRTIAEIAKSGSVAAFLSSFLARKKRSASQSHAVMSLAMAACFDPLPDHPDGFVLPVRLDTGELLPERWQRWLDWDPVRMIPRYAEELRSLRYLLIDCGTRDQYHLQFGARQMKAALERLDVPFDYDEFPDNHSSIDYRVEYSLPRLYAALELR
ncbi:MAG: esterase [Rickettsiales bacterium]|nr:esterase [Rickettsiales bacterium]